MSQTEIVAETVLTPTVSQDDYLDDVESEQHPTERLLRRRPVSAPRNQDTSVSEEVVAESESNDEPDDMKDENKDNVVEPENKDENKEDTKSDLADYGSDSDSDDSDNENEDIEDMISPESRQFVIKTMMTHINTRLSSNYPPSENQRFILGYLSHVIHGNTVAKLTRCAKPVLVSRELIECLTQKNCCLALYNEYSRADQYVYHNKQKLSLGKIVLVFIMIMTILCISEVLFQ